LDNDKSYLGFDPLDPEACQMPFGDIIMYVNAERAALGLCKAKSFILIASDRSPDEFKGEDTQLA
jgi:hypothetical protein